jgi:transcriptional regulator with XRE-family HTH domain
MNGEKREFAAVMEHPTDNNGSGTSDQAKQIGERIVRARNEKGIKQKELADLIHVTARAVTDWETGKVVPWTRMDDIAAILEKPKTWLLHGEEGPLDTSELRRLMEQVAESQRDIIDQIRLLRFDLAKKSGEDTPF